MQNGLFKIVLKKNAGTIEETTAEVFCVERVLSVDPILNRSTQRTEFLVYDGGNWWWINATDTYLKKD
jgi:hypothetical protein